MNRLRHALGESSSAVVVFLLGSVALGWPAVSIAAGRGVTTFFVYLFAVWSLLVLLMLLLSRSGDGEEPD